MSNSERKIESQLLKMIKHYKLEIKLKRDLQPQKQSLNLKKY